MSEGKYQEDALDADRAGKPDPYCQHDWVLYKGMFARDSMNCRRCGIEHRDAIWMSQSHGHIAVGEMDTTHLINTIHYIESGRARQTTMLPALRFEHSQREKYMELSPAKRRFPAQEISVDPRRETSRERGLRERIAELERRIKSLEAERGPGIKAEGEPKTCDVGADWED